MNGTTFQMAHDYATEAAKPDGSDLDANAALARSRHTYLTAYETARRAMLWCDLRAIGYAGVREAIAIHDEATTVVHV